MSKDALLKALEAWHISSSSCKVFVSKNMGRQVAKHHDSSFFKKLDGFQPCEMHELKARTHFFSIYGEY